MPEERLVFVQLPASLFTLQGDLTMKIWVFQGGYMGYNPVGRRCQDEVGSTSSNRKGVDNEIPFDIGVLH